MHFVASPWRYCVAAPGDRLALMDFRPGDGRRTFEEVEIAALVGLADMARENGAVAALEFARRRCPGVFSSREFGFIYRQVQFAPLDVELDEVAVAHDFERAADGRLRRDGQVAGCGAA